jgi:hypothetical protein
MTCRFELVLIQPITKTPQVNGFDGIPRKLKGPLANNPVQE